MPNPWDDFVSPSDTTFGGVEQQMPSAADIAAASPQPITGKKNLIMNNGDSTSPRMVLTNYQASDQKDLPEHIPEPDGKPKPWNDFASVSSGEPWKDFAPTPVAAQADTASKPWEDFAPASPSDSTQAQPWFGKGTWYEDPTASVINKAKSIGEGIVNQPVETLAGIGGSLASMYGMGKEAINQLVPFTHMADGTPVDPDSMMKEIAKAGQRAGQQLSDGADLTGEGYKAGSDLLAAPWAMSGGEIADRAEKAGFPQVAAAINLAGTYSMFLAPKVASDINANKFGTVDDLVNAGRRNTQAKLIEAYAQARTAAFTNVMDSIIPPTEGKYVSDRGLQPSDEQKAMLNEHPEPGPQVPGMDVTDSSTVPHNLKEHLDVIADNPDATPLQRTLANAYRSLNDVLGLDQIPVYGKEGKDPSHYDRGTDSITVASDHPDLNHQILHEADHAINSAAIDFYDKVKDDPAAMENLTPPQQDLMGRVSDFNDVFRASEEEWNRQNPGKEKFNDQGIYPPELHGFKDLHEFATDLKSRPEFQRTLRNLVGSKETMDGLQNKRGGAPIKNMWQAAYRAVKDLFLPGESTMGERNYFSTAYDHATGLTENMTATMRTKGRTFEEKGTALDAKLDAAKKDADVSLRAAEIFNDAHEMRNLLRSAATLEEFKTRLQMQHTDAHWQDYVAANAEKWYDPANRGKLIRVIGEDMDYRKLNRIDQQLAMDPRSPDEFIPQMKEDSGIDKLTPKNERTMFGDEGMVVLPATILKTMKKDTLAGRVMSYFIDQTRKYEILGEQLLHDAKQFMEPFYKLKQTDKDKKMQISTYYDNSLQGRNELLAAGLQWPTREMLQAKSYEPHIIDAYLAETKMVDKMMDLMNQALVKNGHDKITAIPGFMPHVHEGPFKVFVRLTDPAGGARVVQVKGFFTRAGAKGFARSLEQGKWDRAGTTANFRPEPDPVTGENYRVTKPEIIEDAMIENLQDHLKTNANFQALDPTLRQYMEQMESRSMQATLKSSLERSEVSGYLGEMGPVEGLAAKLGVSPHNVRLSKVYDKFMRAVIENYKNTMFQKEVYEPLLNAQHIGLEHGTYYGSFLDALRTTTKYLRESSANFMGQNVNHLKVIDQDINMMLTDQLGLSPKLMSHIADSVRNYVSINALRGNVMFYFSNVIQPGMGLMMLHYINEERRNAGTTTIPNSLVTLGKTLKNRFEPSPTMVAGLQWARENHVLDPLLDLQMLRPQEGSVMDKFNYATGGKVNPYIEGTGKETVFMLAYQHLLDSGMSVDHARSGAAQIVDLTMVNYGRRSRALMFQNYGLLGKMISPFAQFEQHYLGLMGMFGKQMAQNPMKLRSYKVLGSVMAFYWATAGVQGLPVVNMYDGVIGLMQKYIPEFKWPTLYQMLLQAKTPMWMQVAGLSDGTHYPEWMTDGILNASTRMLPGTPKGVHVSAPLGAPQLTGGISTAALPILDALKDIAMLGIKSVIGDAPSKQDWYQATMPIVPQPLRGAAMWAMQPKGSDVVGSTKTTEGKYRMEPADWISLIGYGRPSQDYSHNAEKEMAVKAMQNQNTQAYKGLVKIGVDAEIRGDHASADVDAAVKSALDRNYITHAEEYYKAVADAITGQKRTARELDAEKADSDLAARNRMTLRYQMDRPNEN